MNRREFFGTAGPPVLLGGMVALGINALRRGDEYLPVGHLAAGMPGSFDVDFVTLNGERVDRVVELNDVEGWLTHYGPNLEIENDSIRTFHRTGTVRIHWRKRA